MKKMNNKGFSLVELIIVIAIMAILIVVLAPQYLKYVEKSRNSTDLQSATEFKDACEIWAADPEAGEGSTVAFAKGETNAIKVTKDGIDGTIPGSVASALDNAGVSTTKFKCVSKTNWSDFTLGLKVNDNGSITWTYSDSGANNNFGKAMNANSN